MSSKILLVALGLSFIFVATLISQHILIVI
ncbi:hypothetical protein LEWO105114_02120 [Legionella worsleiensis]|nr:Uncharacterised protein [Legionella worsleiensis]